MTKPKIMFKETFKKGVEIDSNEVQGILKSKDYKITTEIVDRGKYDNEDEFMTVKIILKK